MIELWAGQVAAMTTWQMMTLIALAINVVVQVLRLQKMEVDDNA